MLKEEFYSNYELIEFSDGSGRAIRVPLQVDRHVDGQLDARRTCSMVEVNSGLDESLFLRPAGDAYEG